MQQRAVFTYGDSVYIEIKWSFFAVKAFKMSKRGVKIDYEKLNYNNYFTKYKLNISNVLQEKSLKIQKHF